MAVPAVIAYKEKGDLAKLVVYAIAAIAIIYALYKLFGAFRTFGEKVESTVKRIAEGVKELEMYDPTKPLTPDATAKIITKRASKEPDKPYYVDKPIYEGLKEQGKKLPENVKPYTPDYSKTERETSTVGSKLGLWTPKKENTSTVVPRYITNKEYGEIQAKRWEAIAKYYEKQIPEKWGAKPVEPPHILPVKRDLRVL